MFLSEKKKKNRFKKSFFGEIYVGENIFLLKYFCEKKNVDKKN